MKLHSFIRDILIFSAIFVIFLFPPLIYTSGNNQNTLIQWTIPVSNFCYALVALSLYLFYKEKIEIENAFYFLYKIIIPFTLCFGFLFCISLILKAISVFLTSSTSNIKLPDSLSSWIFCISSFFLSAFYEEVLYRFYCPEILSNLLEKIKNRKLILILSETAALLLFAFAHLYLGILSVVNAFIAHFILRFTYKKTKTIIPGFLAHFIYNVISLILL